LTVRAETKKASGEMANLSQPFDGGHAVGIESGVHRDVTKRRVRVY
jgi:hypothetical protein